MIQGVTFGIKHSYEDFGLILSSKEIGLPTPKTESVSVIGRNGDLDLTDALGDDVKFENRKLSFTFSLLNGARDWTATLSNMKVVLLKNTLLTVRLLYVGEVKKTFGATFGNLSMVSIFGAMGKWAVVSLIFVLISVLQNQRTVETMSLPGLQ